ncbi:DegT/DnrJ/EryC1/StrS family aminotransferase [Metabacillus fastidiosus]|uniref:DegT/DnrJ/EryC1/StrS family aminotransferase n=1 Tax=Metabacillus fastidiosus TaxID=1458 RepID=UPI000824DF79|nr:DegT/DnrJ/EryC1/StrS family aminotransferase [Metabacillus fastidiosus]MED4461654.1 DegT/DnrJ/EryC1/StrS family aminotransferase [Metabacillus fastidiosus]
MIPMVDLKGELEILGDPIFKTMKEVLLSGEYILGEKGKELEEKIAQYTGASYGIGVGNGTDALYLALKALNIGQGDEVITTPFTFFATAEVIAGVGAKPVFVDIEEGTYNIDPTKIKEKITSNTKAIIVVHLYGQTAKMDEILEIAKEFDLKVIEDACQAIGTEYKGKRVGSFGNIGCFSFFPSKSLGAYGDAGMIVTNEKILYEKICMLRNHGSEMRYVHSMIGINSRLDEFQAAILLVKLKYLDIFLHKRSEIAKRYTNELNKKLKKPPIFCDRTHTFHQYCIEYAKRDELALFLKQNGIASAIYYPIPLHLQQAFDYLNYKAGDFPVTEKAANNTLALPIFPSMTFQAQDKIISTINRFVK